MPVTTSTGFTLAGGPVGEPALGPVAFMHRASAADNPTAPLGHHTFDSTHIAFGVVTAAVDHGPWVIEGSVFNGREPDENRWDFRLWPAGFLLRPTLVPAERGMGAAGVERSTQTARGIGARQHRPINGIGVVDAEERIRRDGRSTVRYGRRFVRNDRITPHAITSDRDLDMTFFRVHDADAVDRTMLPGSNSRAV